MHTHWHLIAHTGEKGDYGFCPFGIAGVDSDVVFAGNLAAKAGSLFVRTWHDGLRTVGVFTCCPIGLTHIYPALAAAAIQGLLYTGVSKSFRLVYHSKTAS